MIITAPTMIPRKGGSATYTLTAQLYPLKSAAKKSKELKASVEEMVTVDDSIAVTVSEMVGDAERVGDTEFVIDGDCDVEADSEWVSEGLAVALSEAV